MACLVAFSLEAELGLGGVFLFQEPEVMSTQVGGDRDGTWYMWLNGGEVRDSDRQFSMTVANCPIIQF